MLATIGGIVMTLIAVVIMAVTMAAALLQQTWTLTVQVYHAATPYVVAGWETLNGWIA